jgi:hypothetical protein
MLPLESHNQWEVAPGDEISAALEVDLRISYVHDDVQVTWMETGKFAVCMMTLSWLPPTRGET